MTSHDVPSHESDPAPPAASDAPAASSAAYDTALRALAPADTILTALVVSHPSATIRLVNDVVDRVVAGETFAACRFRARLVDDPSTGLPRAQIEVDNIGRALTRWIEATEGGRGASVTMMQILASTDAVEWQATLRVHDVHVDQLVVRVSLGFDALLGRAAVRWRHDSQRSPGLF